MLSIEEKKKLLSEIEIKKCEIEDLEGISQLIKEMHPVSTDWENLRSHSPDYYNWIYFNNPVGNAIVYLAKHKNKVISTFAMAQKKFLIFGNEVIIGKTMDMFTHDDYQGLGLMSKLAQLVFSNSKKIDINTWYVTPSVNSYPIFKNKWEYVETIESYYCLKILDYISLLQGYINKPIVQRILWLPYLFSKKLKKYKKIKIPENIIDLNSFGDDVNNLWSKLRKNLKISIIRNQSYLKWRYIDNPDKYKIFGIKKSDRLVGLIILKKTKRRGLKFGEIMDLLYEESDLKTFKMLLSVSFDYFRKSGCVAVQTLIVKGSKIEKDLKSNGFNLRRKRFRFLLSPESPILEFYSPNNWYLTQGDCNDT